MKKKIIIAIIILIIIAAIGTGAYFALSNSKKKHTVNATSISYICSYSSDFDYSTLSGNITSGGSQNVYLSDDDTLGQILVNVGDTVDIGTPLLSLDTNKLKFDLDSCNLKVQQDDINIQTANRLITKYQNAVPMQEETEPETSDDDSSEDFIDTDNILTEVNALSQAYKGDGTQDNPFIFKCSADCVIDAPIFKAISNNKSHVVLYIYSEDIDNFQYTCTLSPADTAAKISKDYKWSVGSIYELSDGTQDIQLNPEPPVVPCEFSAYDVFNDNDDSDLNNDSDEDFDNVDDDTDISSLPDSIDGMYTQEELNDMIKEQQKSLTELQLQKREDQISASKAQAKYDKATITSTMKGVVTEVNPDASSSDAIVTVSSGTGLYVHTAIDEYTLGTLKTGDTMHLNIWTDNGDEIMTDAKITEISPYPSDSSNEYSYSSNNNLSYYPVTAYIEDTDGIKEGDYAEITFDSNNEDNNIYLDMAYVGSDSKGKYIYITDDKMILHKKYVNTGKTLYGSYIEIKDSINEAAYIASPYTKYVQDGAKAKPDDE